MRDPFRVLCKACGIVVPAEAARTIGTPRGGVSVCAKCQRAIERRSSGSERVECWNCGYDRLVFEACSRCGEYGQRGNES